MTALVKLMRPLNCFLASISVPIVLVTLYGLDTSLWPSLVTTLLGMIVVSSFTAGGNILNDYIDRKVDRINHPNRPIPSGKISPKNALILSGIMFIVSLLLSLFLPHTLPKLIVVFASILMISYEVKLKKMGLSGNITIATLTGLLFVFSGSIYGELMLPLILALLAGLATLGREITKDIQDMKGDLDRNTLPMKIGKSGSRKVISISIITAVVLSPIPYIYSLLPLSYLITVIFADIIFIYSINLLREPRRAQRFIKMAMGVSLIAFLVGGII